MIKYKINEEQAELLSWFHQISQAEMLRLTPSQRSEKWQLEHWDEYNKLKEDSCSSQKQENRRKEAKERREQRNLAKLEMMKKIRPLHKLGYSSYKIAKEMNVDMYIVKNCLIYSGVSPNRKDYTKKGQVSRN